MSLQHLILGLLEDHPMSGYDLHKAFLDSVQNFWTTDRSQIYRTLHKLQRAGWLEIEHVVQSDNPDKKVYHVTDAGREALHQWLITPIDDTPVREGWLGQVFFAANVKPSQTIQLIQTYRKKAVEDMEVLQLIDDQFYKDKDLHQMPRFVQMRYLALRNGLLFGQTMIAWCDEAIAHLEQLEKMDQPSTSEPNNP